MRHLCRRIRLVTSPLLDIGDVTGKNEVIMNDELYDIELLNKLIKYNKNKWVQNVLA